MEQMNGENQGSILRSALGMTDTSTSQWEQKANLYDKFMEEYKDYFDEDGAKTIPSGNQDTKYFLELQLKRLRALGVKLQYDIQKRGSLAGAEYSNNVSGVTTQDVKYTNTVANKVLQRKTKVINSQGKTIYKGDDGEIGYVSITELNHESVDETDTYVCSNCGAISTIRELLDGCPYCNTRYEMDDLYPTVSGFYFLPDSVNVSVKNDVKTGKLLPSIIWGILSALFALIVIVVLVQEIVGVTLIAVALAIIPSLIFGAISGLMAFPIFLAIRVIFEAICITPMLASVGNSKNNLKNTVRKYDPLFSEEVFDTQLNNMVKTMLFTDDWSNLTIYNGTQNNVRNRNVIEVTSRGAYQFVASNVVNENLYLKLRVFLNVIRMTSPSQVVKQNEEFDIVIQRPLSCKTDLGFSIRKVCCKSCAASFDATHNKYCPSCGTEYEAKEDWVVMEFVRRK